MLAGTYRHSLDPKGRLFIPAKLRDELGSDMVLTKSVDHCINVYAKAEWEKLAAKLDELPVTANRNVRRRFYSPVNDVTVDSQGRVLLPNDLREHANLSKDAVIIGVGKYLEIWDAKAWDEMPEDEDIAKALEALGI